MKLIKLGLGLIALVIISLTARAYENYLLDEKNLVGLAREAGPQLSQISAQRLQAEVARTKIDEIYQANLVGRGNYQDSKEKGIAAFVPQFGPTQVFSVGVEKRSQLGMSLGVSAFADQRSTVDGGIDRATRTGVQINGTMDLWKDFLGRTSKTQFDNLAYREEFQKLDSAQRQKNYEIELRKLYWSLVANEESEKISQGLIVTAQRQLKEAKARQANSVGDAGEVARWVAVVAAREGSQTNLGYQKQALIRQLKELLPGLHGKSVKLAPYSLDQSVNQVLQCTQAIAKIKDVPWDATTLDEMIKLVEQEYAGNRRINSRHSGIDVQLEGQLQVSGVDQGASASYNDLQDEGQTGYALGVRVSLPLGGQSKKAEQVIEDYDRQRYLAESQMLLGKIRSQHEEIGGLVVLLKRSMASADVNSRHLQKSIAVMNRKYRQARVPVSALIADEEALFQSLLAEVNIKLTVVHALLDYFQVFNQFPCDMNRY